MEKTKKKLSKKAVIIGSVVLAVVLVVGGVFIYKYTAREKLYTFDEITQGLSEQVSYVVDADGELTQEEIDEIYERYKRVSYLKKDEEEQTETIKGRIDRKRQLKFYDDNNNQLFDISEYTYGIVYLHSEDEYNKYIIRTEV